MNKFALIAFSLAGALAAGSVAANEVVLTAGQAKNSANRVALDFENSGGVSGFEFELVAPKGAKIDTSSCLSELPASHTGVCQVNSQTGHVIVMVYSTENKPLPAGMVSLGWLGAPAGTKVERLLVSDNQGHSLPVSATAQAAGDHGRKPDSENSSER